MVEPLTTTALIGGGAWFANKILGPSADALGDQLKAYTNDRLGRIFRKAEEKATGLELEPVPAGFAYQFVQFASFSEDHEKITDMWANLLLSSAQGITSRHATFVSILSQLSHVDARVLDRIASHGFEQFEGAHVGRPGNLVSSFRHSLSHRVKHCPVGKLEAQKGIYILREEPLYWPSEIINIEFPYLLEEGANEVEWHSSTALGQPLSYDILVRQQLVEWLSFDLSKAFTSPRIEGVLLTTLGVEFLLSCRGKKRVSPIEIGLSPEFYA